MGMCLSKRSCCFCFYPKKKYNSLFTPVKVKQTSESDRILASILQVLFKPVIPMVCKLISKTLIINPKISILKYEEPHTIHNATDPMEEQVLKDIKVNVSKICLVSEERLEMDRENMPSFDWPEKDNVKDWLLVGKKDVQEGSNEGEDETEEPPKKKLNDTAVNSESGDESKLKSNPQEGERMVVLDLNDLELQIFLGNGIEFEFPLTAHLNIELGCGGNKVADKANIKFCIPKLRLWAVRKNVEVEVESEGDDEDGEKLTEVKEQLILYLAFFGRPQFIPFLHYNLDKGNGDFWNGTIEDSGSLQEVVESILAGFGPSEWTDITRSVKLKDEKEDTPSILDGKYWTNFFGSMFRRVPFGNEISRGLTDLLMSWGLIGKGKDHPLMINLTEVFNNLDDILIGNVRPVEKLEFILGIINHELERSKDMENKKNNRRSELDFAGMSFI